jgi:hypothetical protein
MTVVACLVATGCAPGGSVPSDARPNSSAASTPAAEQTSTANPSAVVVRGIDNIFGAGHETAPDPGSGGGGRNPAPWPLRSGTIRVVTFPSVTGEVNPREGDPFNGPGGTLDHDTDIESFGGISGIVHPGSCMFLVGVFLTDEEPADPAPARIDFTDNEDFDRLEPEIAQTFFIGDGVGRSYLVPDDATRLFMGFADAYSGAGYCNGKPGYYDNNSGELEVTVAVSAG